MFNPTPAPTPVAPPKPAVSSSAPMRDMAIGTDDDLLDENGVVIPEDVLDKVLKESGVVRSNSFDRPKRRDSKKPDVFVDRI